MRAQKFPARFEQLDHIRDYVGRAARKAGMDSREIYTVQLAVDEACSNIIEHAYAETDDNVIECSCEIKPGVLTVRLRDWGMPFDPSVQPEPSLSANLSEREIGGLGLYLMRNLMDDVIYSSSEESGNELVLVKKSAETTVKHVVRKRKSLWRRLLELDDKVNEAPSFSAQYERIFDIISDLVDGEVTLWLDESQFRLPDWQLESLLPPLPPTDQMVESFDKEVLVRSDENGIICVPIADQHKTFGVVQVQRSPDLKFKHREIDLLKGLAAHTAGALTTAHRVAVERWRTEQLALVRSVSAQIANVTDLDELSRRVVYSIQKTFKYYYVAIFTCHSGEKSLRFRSSAGAVARRKGKSAPVFEANLGEGIIGQVAESGHEILCNDVRLEPRFRQIDSLPETQSEVAIPLKIEDQVLGVLDVQSNQLNAFHPSDLLVLRALADSIAVAIEGANLYSDLDRRASQLVAITEVGRSITSILDLPELMQEVASILNRSFGYPYLHLFTVHPNRRQILYGAGSGARSTALEGYSLSLDNPEGLIPWVARNRETVIANDVSKEPRYRPSPLPPSNTLSEMVVPLVFGDRVVGILDVQSDRLNAFSDEDRLLFEAFSDFIASAIHNADLYSTEQWRRQTADSLREVAGLLSANASLDEVLDAILTELERNLPADILTIWLLDEDDIQCAGVRGAVSQADVQDARNDPQAALWLTRALIARESLIRSPGDPMGPAAIAAGYQPDHSSVAAPLRIGDQAVGVLSLAHHTPGRYGHEARAIITTFASYAAVAIENARLYASTQEQAYASAALLQVAGAVVSLAELDEILGTIVRVLPILVGVERAAIYLWDEDHDLLQPGQQYDIPEEAVPLLWRVQKPAEFPLIEAAIVRGEPIFSAETYQDPIDWPQIQPASEAEQWLLPNSEDRLLMVFPLTIKDATFGVLLIEEAPGGRRFRNRRIEILTGVAQQAALAIQNDRFEQEMRVRERLELEVQLAQQIQQTLMPATLPRHPGWELDSRWRTARQVGGDFFDVLTLPGNRLGLFIADVADKGMPAALFMVLTRTLLHATVIDAKSPADVMCRLNDLLYPDTQQGMFVTAVYGELELETGLFTFANAGHNPPIWIHESIESTENKIELLTRTGMALGVLEGTVIGQRSIQFEPGDHILLYTDGVTEAFSPDGEMFGEEKLFDLVNQDTQSIIQMLDNIDAALDRFIDTDMLADDVTMLAVRRLI